MIFNPSIYKVCLCCLLAIFIVACDKPSSSNGGQPESSPPVSEGPLIFYNWEDYIGSETLAGFTSETGISVQLVTFEDDEAILGAIQSGLPDVDLIVVSRSVAMEMTKAKLVSPIDIHAIPNLVNLHGSWLPPDHEHWRNWMVPYCTGTTGLVVNSKHVDGDIETWKILWDERYAGRVAMLNNPFEVTGAASKMLGFPLNADRPEQLQSIREALLRQRPLLAGYFDPVTIGEMMAAERLWAAQLYNGDAMMAAEQNEDIRYVLPREGAAIWFDVFVIPRQARHMAEAHAFIDYVHRPEIMGAIASEIWTATPNTASRAFTDPAVLQAPEVYPSEEKMALCETFGDMGSEESVRTRQEIWAELQSER
ncbi:MAG: spermidine/putrescine ABC transporter substrate-binding protein [Deltaproteobacteria bacterium]|nr:spermidine/putrescine ABC transporter substrate-binding protein [Deltaproteobacteria bacterium]